MKYMEKIKLSYEQEANMLYYLLNQRGRVMKGDVRGNMYEIYKYFNGDRDESICSCLDRDTARKVDNFINGYSWSDETRFTPRFRDAFPHLALVKEELQTEPEISTQPIDMNEVLEGMVKAKSVPVKPVKKVKTKK